MNIRESLFSFLRRKAIRWYMAAVAGRYCPCEWPIKSKRLMHLCGRIDDAAERDSFRDFCGFWLNQTQNTTASNATVTVNWKWKHGR